MPIKHTKRSMAAKLLGLGLYVRDAQGQLYYICGNTRIKVNEHFSESGKTMDALMEDVIQFSAKQTNSSDAIRSVC